MPDIRFTKVGQKHGVVLSYTREELHGLSEKGLFLEAFGRLDKMIDQACFGLMHKRFSASEKLVSALVDDDFSGLDAAKVLYKSEVLGKALYDKIKAFKQARNVVTHDIYGHYAFALRQAEEVKDEADLKKKSDSRARAFLKDGEDAFSELMRLLKG